MTTAQARHAVLASTDEFADALRLTNYRVRWLFERAKVEPVVQGAQGRGRKTMWPADYLHLARALDRLAEMNCPGIWLSAVAAWWAQLDPEALGGARYLVVSPSRERAPVFLVSRNNVGGLLAGCHAWIIDLLDQQTYR